ncbi:MAG: hypothetical protein RJA22_1710 [Verrucomicrobiota bacterium]
MALTVPGPPATNEFVKAALFLPWVAVSAALAAPEHPPTLHSFRRLHLEKHYWSEGATFGDLNRDGKPDAISGPYWWEAPDFTRRHEMYAPRTTFKVRQADGTETVLPGFEGALGRRNAYSSDNFFSFVHDLNGDGWNDVLTYGLPGTPAYLYLNPQGAERPWQRHTVFEKVDNESPTFADLTGDGKPEIICNHGGNFGYAAPDWGNPTAPWRYTAISAHGKWGNFTHGLGIGDVNGDGRLDYLEKGGWWEQPPAGAAGAPWARRPVLFSPGGGAQMYAYDVNGDGLNDVISSIAAHGYGLAWHEQLREKDTNGHPKFREHTFMNKEPGENRYGVAFSQLHAVELVDMDGDGLKDLVTGKCFWAHGPTGDPEPGAPAVLYWFRLVRGPGGRVDWVPHRIDSDSGVGRQIGVGDANGDGRPDLIIGNKKGTFVFLHEARSVSREEWEKAQPAVKFATAGDKALQPGEVIQRTGPPRGARPAPAAPAPPR